MTKISHRQQILVFLAATFFISALLQFYIIREVKTTNTFIMVFLLWIPGFVGVACSQYFGNKLRDLALVKPGRLSVLFAYAIPAGSAFVMFFILVLSEIGTLKFPENSWFRYLLYNPTIGVLVNGVLILGQELGWRGFLQNRLMRAHIPEPLIATGLIWAIWHWPLILFLDFSTSPMPWLSVLLFTVQTVSFAVILGWLREFSKSIVPPVLAHAVHITWLQHIVPGFYVAGKLDPYFGGQSGFVLAIIYLMIAMYIYRFHPVGRY